MIIQIYGIRTVKDARMVVELGATNIGVSYGKIKRTPGQVTCETAKEIFEKVQPGTIKVGLTIAEDIEEISENLRAVEPDILHLCGHIEAIKPKDIMVLKSRFPRVKIMQAIPVLADIPLEEQKAMEYVRQYETAADLFLIDTKSDKVNDIGATGIDHDRMIDRKIIESTSLPCIIAGGLNEENVVEAIRITKPYGVDSFTFTNLDVLPTDGSGIKDPEKVKRFIEAVRSIC